MSGKNVTKPYLWLDAADMGGSITSPSTDVAYTDNIGIQLNFTGTPTGTFAVQGSIDSINWSDLTFASVPQALGVAGVHLFNLNQIPYQKIRLVYTRTSGTGALTAYVMKKAVGS